MSRSSPPAVVLLLLLGGLIWGISYDRWSDEPGVLLIVALLPLAWRLARLEPTDSASPPSWRLLLVGAFVLSLGLVTELTSWMAFGWAICAVQLGFPPSRLSTLRLSLVTACAFPWILLDFFFVGWWFRITGAAATGEFFKLLSLDVTRDGTQIIVAGLPISVEAACSGLQLLQLLLSGGTAIAILHFPRSRRFWLLLVLLPAIAWVANTLRIIAISVWGLTFGIASAEGAFHSWGALLVIACMLIGTLGLAHLLESGKPQLSRPETTR